MKKNLFVLAALVIGHQLSAQQDTTSMDEAVVTANKFSTKTSLTGKVVNIIDAQQLRQSGAKDLAQVLNEAAGFYVGGANSNAGKDKSIYLRGANPAFCLVTIDGIPVYDPTGIGGNFDLRNLSIDQVERIEIVKGSQSTLYGSDAIAGVINIITKKNSGKPINGEGGVSYGSYQTFKANASLFGKTGIVDYRLSYSHHNTRGLDEAVSINRMAHTDHDKYEQNDFSISGGIRPSSKVYMAPFFRYGKLNGDIDQGAFTDELDYTYSQKSWQTGLRNEFSIGKSKLTVLYQYNKIDRLYIDDSVLSRNGYDTYSNTRYKGSEHLADAYIHFQLAKKLRLTTGADWRRSTNSQLYISLPAYGPPAAFDSTMHQESVYAAANYNGSKGFNMEAGGRINFHSAYGHHIVYNLDPSFLLHKKWKFFANLSTGYRTASLYQLYSEYGNKKLKPEASTSLEGGIQFADNKIINVRAVYFYRKIKDGIFFYFNPVTYASQYINQDRQQDHGLELELEKRFSNQVRLKAWYAYVTGRITTVNSGKDTTYYNLLRRPKSAAGASISFNLNKQLLISSSLTYAGDRKDAYFDSNTFSTVYVTLKAYALGNLYAQYALAKNKLKLFADLRNITDSHYTEISGFNTMGLNLYFGAIFSL